MTVRPNHSCSPLIGLVLAAVSPLSPRIASAAEISWSQYWERAQASSPRLQQLETKKKQVRSEVALESPAPMVAVGSLGENGPVSGVMERTYEISQKIPFPTKFSSASQVKEGRIRTQELENQVAVLDLKKKAFFDFVDLVETLKRRELILEKQKFFAAHLKRLRAYSVSDQIQQLHILEMESEQKSIQAELLALEGEERSLRTSLGSLISETGGVFQDVPQLEGIDLNQPVPKIAAETNLSLKRSQANEDLEARTASLAKGAWAPDLSLTYRRHIRLDNVMPSSHEVVVGIELPFLLGWQPSSKSEAAGFAAQSAGFDAAQRARDAKSEIEALTSRLEAERGQLKLLHYDILPSLDQRMHLLHRLAQTDMESLDLHRTTYEQVLAGQQKNLKLETQYRKDRLELETLGGGTP